MLLNKVRTSHFFVALLSLWLLSQAFPAFAVGDAFRDTIEVTGEITVLHADDFDNKRSKLFYRLKEIHGDREFNLHVPSHVSKRLKRLKTGDVVTIHGRAEGRDFYLAADGQEQAETVLPAETIISGEQKTVVILVDFLDTSLSCTGQDIENLMFTDPEGNSVDNLYQETSLGQVWFSGDVVGPYTINYSSTDTCDFYGWAMAAENEAIAAGIDLSVYSRKVYAFPRQNQCNFIGMGTVGGNPSMSWIFRCDMEDLFAHELGHNMGMNHSATPTNPYGDISDIMGYSSYNLRQINAPHQIELGWRMPEQTEKVTSRGVYDIAPLEFGPWDTSIPQILILDKPDTGESYYLSYRQPIGFDANLHPAFINTVSIHSFGTYGDQTILLDTIAVGDTFFDSVNGITISLMSQSADGATVEIGFEQSCAPAMPSLSVTPSAQSASAGMILQYTVSLTNKDNPYCEQSSFSLGTTLPAGWSGYVSPSTLTLAPGETGQATIAATSPLNAAAGVYSIEVAADDPMDGAHSNAATASYEVLPACEPAVPVIAMSPSSQSGLQGATLNYTVTVTNTDNPACDASTFALDKALPGDWSGTLMPTSLLLQPGGSGTATLSVTSPSTAQGLYALQVTISDSAAAIHATSATAEYNVLGDTEPPSSPTELSAAVKRKNITLSWTAATDNVGVAGYFVMRDGFVVATTAETKFVDSNIEKGAPYVYTVIAYDQAGNVSGSDCTLTTGQEDTKIKIVKIPPGLNK